MGRTMPITPFLEDNVVGPQEIRAMSIALEDLCNILNMDGLAKSERELLAQHHCPCPSGRARRAGAT